MRSCGSPSIGSPNIVGPWLGRVENPRFSGLQSHAVWLWDLAPSTRVTSQPFPPSWACLANTLGTALAPEPPPSTRHMQQRPSPSTPLFPPCTPRHLCLTTRCPPTSPGCFPFLFCAACVDLRVPCRRFSCSPALRQKACDRRFDTRYRGYHHPRFRGITPDIGGKQSCRDSGAVPRLLGNPGAPPPLADVAADVAAVAVASRRLDFLLGVVPSGRALHGPYSYGRARGPSMSTTGHQWRRPLSTQFAARFCKGEEGGGGMAGRHGEAP